MLLWREGVAGWLFFQRKILTARSATEAEFKAAYDAANEVYLVLKLYYSHKAANG